MSKKGNKGNIVAKIMKILAVIALIFAVLSSAFFIIFKSSIDKANSSGTIPKVFGKEFITVSSDKFNDIVPKGSLVILSPVDKSNLSGTEVLVYETGNTTVDNSVYGKFSLGRTMKTPDNSNKVESISIQNVINEKAIDVPLSSIKSQAMYQISYLGNLISKVSSGIGLLQFIVMPISIFIILLLVILIIKILSNQDEENEQLTNSKNAGSKRNSNKKYNNDTLKHSDDEEIYEDRLVKLKDRYVNNLESEDEEKLNLNFEKKQPTVISEVVHSNDIKPSKNEEIEDKLNLVDTDINIKPVSMKKEDFSNTDNVIDKNIETNDIVSKLINENIIPQDTPKSNYDDASAQVDEFLRSLNIDLDSVESEYMKHTTIEFDMDKLDDKLLNDNIPNTDKSQELLDNILIDLKDNAVDFRFNSLKSDDVEIKESRKGDGFTIKTPNYKANIKVEIDKN